MQMISRSGVVKSKFALAVSGIFITNIYGIWLNKITGLDSFIFFLPWLVLLVIESFNKKKIEINRGFVPFYFLCFAACVGHIIITPTIKAVKYLIYMIAFLLAIQCSNKNVWNVVRKAIIFISYIMCIDAILQIPKVLGMNYNIYNIRRYTMVDKPQYSLILTLSILLQLIDIQYDKNKKWHLKLLSFISIAISLIISIFVIQSKSGIVCLVIAIGMLLYKLPKKQRRYFLILIVITGGAVALFSIMNPDKIPVYVKAMFFQYTGLFSNESDLFSNYLGTYDLRDNRLSLGLKLFATNPFGIGFGNFAQYGLSEIGLMELESSFLNSFVEGGVLFGLGHAGLLISIIYNMIKENRRDKNQQNLEILIVLIVYLFLIFQNDYMGLGYWVLLGTFAGLREVA